MIKHVCDICGKDATYNDFIIPANHMVEAKGGKKEVTLKVFSKLEPTKMDLCDGCMQFIANYIDYMKQQLG